MADRTLQAETNGGLGYTETAGAYEAKIDPSNLSNLDPVAATEDYLIVSDGGVPKKIAREDFKAIGIKDNDDDTFVELAEGDYDKINLWIDGSHVVKISVDKADLQDGKSLYCNGEEVINSSRDGTFLSLKAGSTGNEKPVCRWRGKSDFDMSLIPTPHEDGDVAYDETMGKIRVYNSGDSTWYPIS